jgi:beta-glucosidase/6-phospho-beta-glucosidase/beta-galactosidase
MSQQLFSSFLMGGYECADHINRSGDRVNLLFDTAHHERVIEDYQMLADCGIKTVREGICWSNVEKEPFVYDFSEVKKRLDAANQCGIQQLWDICHFGFPDDMIPTHPRFALRFSALCSAFALFYREHSSNPLIVTPINEISFLSWHAGDVRGTVPFAVNSGFDIKYHLCKAAIAGIRAFKNIEPHCRIVLIEPLVKIHAREDETDMATVNGHNENQFQAMDIIGGRMCPELGGDESFLDILGFNYYYDNQWEHNGGRLHWPEDAAEQEPLSSLLFKAWKRYHRPIIIGETGHFDDMRAEWFEMVAEECLEAMRLGVNLQGVCLYPVIGRVDWDNLNCYHASGLYDINNPMKQRIVHAPLLNILRQFHGFTKQAENVIM